MIVAIAVAGARIRFAAIIWMTRVAALLLFLNLASAYFVVDSSGFFSRPWSIELLPAVCAVLAMTESLRFALIYLGSVALMFPVSAIIREGFVPLSLLVVMPLLAATALLVLFAATIRDQLRRLATVTAQELRLSSATDRQHARTRAIQEAHRIIHDQLSSMLSAAMMMRNCSTEPLRTEIGVIQKRFADAALPVSAEQNVTFAEAVEEIGAYCASFSAREKCRLTSEFTEGSLPASSWRPMLAAAEEALRNAALHAHADQIWVSFEGDAEGVTLTVRDNGSGFDPEMINASRQGIRESILGRMSAARCRAEIHSSGKSGTTVVLGWGRAPVDESSATSITPHTQAPSALIQLAKRSRITLFVFGITVLAAEILMRLQAPDPVPHLWALAGATAFSTVGIIVITAYPTEHFSLLNALVVAAASLGNAVFGMPIPHEEIAWQILLSFILPAALIVRGANVIGIVSAAFPFVVVTVEFAYLGPRLVPIMVGSLIFGVVFCVIAVVAREALQRIERRITRSVADQTLLEERAALLQDQFETASAVLQQVWHKSQSVLHRMQSQPTIDDDLYRDIQRLDAEVRDQMIAPGLQHPTIQSVVAWLREGGTQVDFVPEEIRGLPPVSDAAAETIAKTVQSKNFDRLSLGECLMANNQRGWFMVLHSGVQMERIEVTESGTPSLVSPMVPTGIEREVTHG